MQTKEIPLDQLIEPSWDVRTYLTKEDLEELADSIKAVGVLQPLRVFKNGTKYEIEDGHRRYLAAGMLSLATVPCIIIESEEDQRDFKKLHANIHSKGLTAMELSRTLHHLKDKFDYTMEELGKLMGKSQGRVSQLLALINWAPDIQELVEDRQISEHIGHELNKIKDPDKRKYYTKYAMNDGATLQVVKNWVAQALREETGEKPPVYDPGTPPAVDPDLVPKMRCGCCKGDFNPETLHLIRFCGECITDIKNIMPEIYQAMKQERGRTDSQGG